MTFPGCYEIRIVIQLFRKNFRFSQCFFFGALLQPDHNLSRNEVRLGAYLLDGPPGQIVQLRTINVFVLETFMYTHTHTHTHTYLHISYIRIHTHTYIYIFIHIYIYTHICIFADYFCSAILLFYITYTIWAG